MTTTPLPPLPKPFVDMASVLGAHTLWAAQMQAYARQARADLEEELSAHKAARRAYASEFLLDSEGEPDVGSIHQNIRALKAENQRLREALQNLSDAIEQFTNVSTDDWPELAAARAALKDTK